MLHFEWTTDIMTQLIEFKFIFEKNLQPRSSYNTPWDH